MRAINVHVRDCVRVRVHARANVRVRDYVRVRVRARANVRVHARVNARAKARANPSQILSSSGCSRLQTWLAKEPPWYRLSWKLLL